MRTHAKRLLAFFLCILMLTSSMVIPVFAKSGNDSSSSGEATSPETSTAGSDVTAILNALSYDEYQTDVLNKSKDSLLYGLVDVIRAQYPELESDEIYSKAEEALKEHKIEIVLNPEEGNDKQYDLLDGVFTITSTGASTVLKDDSDRLWKDYASDAYDTDLTDGVVVGANGTVTWTIDIPAEYSGNYTIEIKYAQVSKEKYEELDNIELDCSCVDSDTCTHVKDPYTMVDKLGLRVITNNAIERIFCLNGEIPFSEARALVLSKLFTYDYAKDANGNLILNDKGSPTFEREETKKGEGDDIRPSVIQKLNWVTYSISDSNGYRLDPFEFYLKPGKNTISLQGEREDMVIQSITLKPLKTAVSYDEYKRLHADAEKIDLEKNLELEAEAPTYVSAVTMYPVYDRTSAITQGVTGDQSPSYIKYNTMGKEQWQNVGEWVEYTVTVPKAGYYSLAIRYKQSLLSGMYVSRKLYINGEVPFAEAATLRFAHSNSWQSCLLGDGENAYDFYLEEGKNVIRLEATLGDMGAYIKQVSDSLSAINNCYLEIIKLTGTDPDTNRSYGFTRVMPHVMESMLVESQNLKRVYDYLVEQNKIQEGGGTGEGEKTATIKQVYELLEEMATDESQIPSNLATLKSQIGSLGTWINSAKTQPLQVDFLRIQSSEDDAPKADAGFFEALWFEIRLFFASFALDFSESNATTTEGTTETIEVWVVTGRDQAQIIKNLIENKFTPDSKIAVNIKLISGGTLLPSIIAGVGPEVSLMETSTTIIDYALRNAIKPLNEFINADISNPNEENILDEFPEAALEPLTLYDFRYGEFNDSNTSWQNIDLYQWRDDGTTIVNGTEVNYLLDAEYSNGNFTGSNKYGYNWQTTKELSDGTEKVDHQGIEVYALPDSLTFSMMFYRKDVMESLELAIPKTWDDMLAILPILQFNNMEIGIQNDAYTFIYQSGYEAYSNNGMTINFDNPGVTSAFKQMCNYYTQYSLPYTFDFANRFRTGEMPIGIAPYTTCNQLSVFASELSGLWTFTPIPGQEGGNADAVATVTGCVMIDKDDDNASKEERDEQQKKYEAAWEFMKWYTGSEFQSDYANEIVSILGVAARPATANEEALVSLPWNNEELTAIKTQFANLTAVQNHPGSYYLARYVNFAFLAAYNDGEDAADALSGYAVDINVEINRRREEFDMMTLDQYLSVNKDGALNPEKYWVTNKDGKLEPKK